MKVILQVLVEDLQFDYTTDASLMDTTAYEMTKEDCLKSETFDEKEKTCIAKAPLVNDTKDFSAQYINKPVKESENNGTEGNVKYKINLNNIDIFEGKTQPKHKEIWNLFTSLIPLNYLTDFENYVIFDDIKSDVFAYVVQNETNNEKWNLAVNL